MEYVLIGFLYLNTWEAGGVITQEFSSKASCEYAKAIVESQSYGKHTIDNYVGAKFLVCVKK